MSNSLSSRSAPIIERASCGSAFGLVPRKSAVTGGPHWARPRGRERRPAGLQRVVEHVAVGEVLDQEAVRVAPVVEDLAALDVPADAPGPD